MHVRGAANDEACWGESAPAEAHAEGAPDAAVAPVQPDERQNETSGEANQRYEEEFRDKRSVRVEEHEGRDIVGRAHEGKGGGHARQRAYQDNDTLARRLVRVRWIGQALVKGQHQKGADRQRAERCEICHVWHFHKRSKGRIDTW